MSCSSNLWQTAPLAASTPAHSPLSPVLPFSPAPSFSPSHSCQSSVSSVSSSASLITPAPWIPRSSNSDRALKTGSVYSDRSYRPLPTLPRSNSMSSLRGPLLPRPNVRAPFTPTLTIPTIPHALAEADSPSPNVYMPSPGIQSPQSALPSPASGLSLKSCRSVRRLPQTPDKPSPQPRIGCSAGTERPQISRNATTTALRAPRRPLPPSLSRSHTVLPLAADKYDAPTPRRSAHEIPPVPTRRASPPTLKLVTALQQESSPHVSRPRSNSSPATPVSGISTPLSAEQEKSQEDVLRANLAKVQRVLSASVPPELVLYLRDDDEDSTSSTSGGGTLEGLLEDDDEDDDDVPMSAIEFSAPSPVSTSRPALVARHASRVRPVWAAEARSCGSGDKMAEDVPLLRTMPVADAFDRESKRMSRKWVREVKGRRWVEEDIQDVVMQLRLLRR